MVRNTDLGHSLITFGGASSELGFYYRTGGEIEWSDAGDFVNDEGLSVLVSESSGVLVAALIIIIVSWFTQTMLYSLVGNLVSGLGKRIASGMSPTSLFVIPSSPNIPRVSRYLGAKIRPQKHVQHDPEDVEALMERPSTGDSASNDNRKSSTSSGGGEEKHSRDSPSWQRRWCFIPSWVLTSTVLVFVGITAIIRPDKPFNHMATSLPSRILDSFRPTLGSCASNNEWPLKELIDKSKWLDPSGDFKGWAPGTDNNKFVKQYRENPPKWLPEPIPAGFLKWDKNRYQNNDKDVGTDDACPNTLRDRGFYNPVNDPMRISNLNQSILAPVKEALSNNSVKIRHIVLILMESMREELFPIQQDTDIHRFIMDSHEKSLRDEVNARVSRMTPNAEKITGKPGNYKSENGSTYDRPTKPEWNDKTKPGFGGINVIGGLTSSSVSTKSLATTHCGAWPMAVNMFEEAVVESYQPCIPQVLELFNTLKGSNNTKDAKVWSDGFRKPQDEFHEYQWYPAFFQAVTDTYDRQDIFDAKIGFKYIFTKGNLDKEAHDKPEMEKINYFGYPETDLKEHIEKYITDGLANNQRLFISHFTSTTHHPWGMPKWFETEKYMGKVGKRHQDFNKYLNTVRFTDAWLGELMQMFDDTGIADETLVVFVGDHGQAFREDSPKTGTYENRHISNFRVPISFHHPNIPRVQYEANVTSISILPTILDLLINTGSLNAHDTAVASDLVNDFEGQSLIRPYHKSLNGRRAWNFGLINPGGGMIAVTSADAPWRLVIPLKKDLEYTFTDIGKNPREMDPLNQWSIKPMIKAVKRKYGLEAADWVREADQVAHWWSLERTRLWGYKLKGD
ncbi:alkaline-phosphatase-like protein [Fusarium redolens]|uniref:Alkaline-phosphatase-like protein n=1 Tax=Fusarium redolens TaxID=48865 RepID=A0A9P9G724_FUSRE|nr:alkaline-phosphatase-like protein [Fusarium redolens]KAH7233746.1 alkaline-phosphatase-like protein [Fusarium redolens]